jgi:hypothetical protein
VASVAGIIIFNKWQESRHRQHADRAFPDNKRDPLLERGPDSDPPSEPREPVNEKQDGEKPVDVGDKDRKNEPIRLHAVKHSRPPLPDRLDSRVDCCIRIESVEPIEAPRLWAAQAEVFDNLSRSLRWYAFDDRENQWRRITANALGAHHWYLSALQLVDRDGMISDNDFHRYTKGVQRLADRFHAVPAGMPSRADVISSAKTLDRFCAEVDVQIAINIVSEQPMAGNRLFLLAEAEGLRLESDGCFHARAADSRTLYVLTNGEPVPFERGAMPGLQTRCLSLILDLPRVIDAAAEFENMMRFATHLSKTLGATVVDDNGKPFGTESVEAIRARVRRYQTRMNEEGIPPGGSLARRLFDT